MKEASIDAAETLLQRFWEKAGVIQAWEILVILHNKVE